MTAAIGLRTLADLKESTLYGDLYRIERQCGRAFICARVRRRGKELFVNRSDTITIQRTPESALVANVGNFVFKDRDGRWALWAPQGNIEVKE
jgi:hypothetical protein